MHVHYFIHYQTFKTVIERDLTEKQDNQEKIDRLEKENEWVKSKNSKKSKPNKYVMTLEGQLSSLQEDTGMS